MELCENTKSTLIGVPKCDGKNEIKVKCSSGYHPGELPQPSNAGQNSIPGNTENATKEFLKKRNWKAHNFQIYCG